MDITPILKLLPNAPSAPRNLGVDWQAIEGEIGLALPRFYKDLISHLGSGSIGDFLWILNPVENNQNLNFDSALYFQEAYKILKTDFPEDYSRPPFPESGSFFTWAATDNGDSLFWVIDGPADGWKVGIHDKGQGEREAELTGLDTYHFLKNLLSHELSTGIFPDDFLAGSFEFSPYEKACPTK